MSLVNKFVAFAIFRWQVSDKFQMVDVDATPRDEVEKLRFLLLMVETEKPHSANG